MRHRDPVSISQAAWILGCSTSTVQRMMHDGRLPAGDPYSRGRLSKSDVEKVSSMVYPWRRHLHDPWSYWVIGQDAADLLGIDVARLEQLAISGRVPFVEHRDGTRLYRRSQLKVMARR
jgi:excisionase family DNA binding protein